MHERLTQSASKASFVFLSEKDEEEAAPESRQAFEFAAARILDLSFMFSLVKLFFSSAKIFLLKSRSMVITEPAVVSALITS